MESEELHYNDGSPIIYLVDLLFVTSTVNNLSTDRWVNPRTDPVLNLFQRFRTLLETLKSYKVWAADIVTKILLIFRSSSQSF